MKTFTRRVAALGLPLFLSCVGFCADNNTKKPAAPPAKPAAAPAHAAPAAHPAGAAAPGRGAAPAATHPAGPTTANPAAGRGPTTANPAAHAPITTANPAGRGAATTANPGGRGAAPAPGRAGGPAGRENPGVARGGMAPGRAGGMPGHEVHMANGGSARFGNDGHVREVHSRGMDIHRSPTGGRRVIAERPDHSRVFAEGRGRGYVQRPYSYHGREFASRTYFVNGRPYPRYYSRYQYRGVFIEVYSPPRFYAAPFYGWAYNPWVAPVPYAWGFVGNPWAVYYGGYFTPYAVYPSASFWLTDYMISQSLAAAYQARLEAANGAPPPPMTGPPAALTPEVKQLVSAEVQRQLALENAEAAQNARNADPDPQSSGIARMLSDNNPHVFVAGGDLSLLDASGQECAVSQGDVLQMVAPPPSTATTAQLIVLATKPQDCAKGNSVAVQLTDLQEMQNQMRQTIDQGLGEIQSHAGQGGLPPIPAPARVPPADAGYVASAPPPDPNVANEINQQLQAADQAEKEAVSQSGGPSADPGPAPPPPPPPAAAPVSEDLTGKTIDQVVQSKGQPKTVTRAGAKTI